MNSDALTSNEVVYPYKGVPLTPAIAQFLIRQLFAGKLVERQVLVEEILRSHLAGGGLKASSQDLSATIKRALTSMKESGTAENASVGYWRILPIPSVENKNTNSLEPLALAEDASLDEPMAAPASVADVELGLGPGAIYVYYLPTYRLRAQEQGAKVWPCKIGRTDRDPLSRVLSQAATALPERPRIAVVIRTRYPMAWETALHSVLTLRGLQIEDSPGTEWFLTSPEEILELAGVFDPSISDGSTSVSNE